MLRLDYVSCFLTILSTILIGKKLWQGWIVAGANSIIICIIGMRTAEFGFLPGNILCMGLYANNLWNWRLKSMIANSPSRPLSNTWSRRLIDVILRSESKPKAQKLCSDMRTSEEPASSVEATATLLSELS